MSTYIKMNCVSLHDVRALVGDRSPIYDMVKTFVEQGKDESVEMTIEAILHVDCRGEQVVDNLCIY